MFLPTVNVPNLLIFRQVSQAVGRLVVAVLPAGKMRSIRKWLTESALAAL